MHARRKVCGRCQELGRRRPLHAALPSPPPQVVNEEFEVLKWASERHTVVLPDGLEDGAIGECETKRKWAGAAVKQWL